MELLYLYVHNDNKNIKGCEYNFSPNYRFTYDVAAKTFYMKWHKPNLQNKWFGDNILNISAIIGKNGAGKTNLLECIIKSLSGNRGGWIIYLHNGQLYTNIPKIHDEIKFSFCISRFEKFGSPLNNELEKRVDDTHVIFYSSSIDRAISNDNSHYSKFNDISNAYLLRKKRQEIGNTPEFAHISDVDLMQTHDIFRFLLFLRYIRTSHKDLVSSLKLPDYFQLTLHAYNYRNLNHPTYNQLTQNLSNNFEDILKLKLLQRIFATKDIPKTWDATTSYNEVISLSNSKYDYNIYDLLLDIYNRKGIIYKAKQQGLMGGDSPFTFDVSIDFIDYKFLNTLYDFYYETPLKLPYCSSRAFDDTYSNSWITINYGVSSGERVLYTLLARIFNAIFGKQGEIHHVCENRIINSHDFDGNTIILLFDEPDLQLHPEWQQKFINTLLSAFSKYFPKILFQIIITSHSPIIISDIPKSNILFIEKGPDGYSHIINHLAAPKETFAANINSLYNDSFFLEGIPIGDFAKEKIQYIYNRLNNGEIYPNILDDIYRIGEPLIKDLLLRLYDSKRQNQAEDIRIQYLIDELRKIGYIESGKL